MRVERVDLRDLVRSALELFEGGSPRHRLVSEVPQVAVPVLRSAADRAGVREPDLERDQVLAGRGRGARTLLTSGGEAVIQVADQGIGIPERDRASIFEPFRRTGNCDRRSRGGARAVRRPAARRGARRLGLGRERGGDGDRLHRPAAARPGRAAAPARERTGRARGALRRRRTRPEDLLRFGLLRRGHDEDALQVLGLGDVREGSRCRRRAGALHRLHLELVVAGREHAGIRERQGPSAHAGMRSRRTTSPSASTTVIS